MVNAESETGNNCSAAFTLTIGSPDLVVESLAVSDPPEAGEHFTLKATVHNQGGGRTAGTTVRFYRSTDAMIDTTDTEVTTGYVSRLGAGESSERSGFLTAPSIGGTYYYGACVDVVNAESDTGNNCSEAVTLSIGSPDLVVASLSVSGNPEAGEHFRLLATVRNQGTGRAGGTTVRYYQSSDGHDRLQGHGSDHGVRQPPGRRRKLRAVGFPDGPVEWGHLLLRGLRRRGHRRERDGEQLLGGVHSHHRQSRPGGGLPLGERQPGGGGALPAAGHGAQSGHGPGGGHHGALLPVLRRRDQHHGHASDHGVRQPAGSRRKLGAVGAPDGSVRWEHLLLRGLRRWGHRRKRQQKQLLNGGVSRHRQPRPGC